MAGPVITPQMIQQLSQGPAQEGSMGEWLLRLWPGYAAENNIPVPGDVQDGKLPEATASGTNVATATPNPAPEIPPPRAENNPIIPPLPQAAPVVNAPAGMSFNGAPNQVNEISPQEEAVAAKAADNAVGRALSGVQAIQPNSAVQPGAPGVPGTRAVDSNLMTVIQALTQNANPRQLKSYIG